MMTIDERIARQHMEEAIPAIIKDVCEIDWHGSSPDDKPSLLTVTVEELTLILRRHLLGEDDAPRAERIRSHN